MAVVYSSERADAKVVRVAAITKIRNAGRTKASQQRARMGCPPELYGSSISPSLPSFIRLLR